MATTVLSLDSFPEELVERILSYCVVASQAPAVSSPAWAPGQPPSAAVRPVCSRLAPLLVCKAFYRISLPHFYHTIHLTRPSQPAHLLSTLHHYPWLSRYVRRVVITGIFDGADQVFRRCRHVKALDITLDPRFPEQAYCPAVERLCDSLEALDAVTHLTIRKPARLYLTHAGVKRLIFRLASAITGWIDLQYAHLAFRISDDSVSPPAAQPRGPISTITHALSLAPSLHTFSTQLPSLWNEAILSVSQNPCLERIVLGGTDYEDGCGIISGGGLYMIQTRKHPRLAELIRNGTPIIRSRAHTVTSQPLTVLSYTASRDKKDDTPTPHIVRHHSLKRHGRPF
ncbi:uncharacterized protein BT62DRAFT_937725 [Guyanagaster necrorhizus]|uniref:F-box domain-containing protein n=1 Tax=Guyanagaster necrorhizus TaxID=856835 RepID=A0A9P8AMH5_9AGAR|nr:uncharacterized protein BT62DRAFT_937725 [Guyanagaster necrorhizus MCA 3950]KAG7440749.1 hypothetical protein BT62DRAFT_937725 [Guyanagaster necrorhizus MCA 3950]